MDPSKAQVCFTVHEMHDWKCFQFGGGVSVDFGELVIQLILTSTIVQLDWPEIQENAFFHQTWTFSHSKCNSKDFLSLTEPSMMNFHIPLVILRFSKFRIYISLL